MTKTLLPELSPTTSDATQIVPASLPFVYIENVNTLPRKPGLYFVLSNKEILYIGRAVNLKNRWKDYSHHRHDEIRKINPDAKVHFYVVTSTDELSIEEYLIKKFNPRLNRTPVKAGKSWNAYVDSIDLFTTDAERKEHIFRKITRDISISKSIAMSLHSFSDVFSTLFFVPLERLVILLNRSFDPEYQLDITLTEIPETLSKYGYHHSIETFSLKDYMIIRARILRDHLDNFHLQISPIHPMSNISDYFLEKSGAISCSIFRIQSNDFLYEYMCRERVTMRAYGIKYPESDEEYYDRIMKVLPPPDSLIRFFIRKSIPLLYSHNFLDECDKVISLCMKLEFDSSYPASERYIEFENLALSLTSHAQ